MRERVRQLGGNFDIHSGSPGTVVSASFPAPLLPITPNFLHKPAVDRVFSENYPSTNKKRPRLFRVVGRPNSPPPELLTDKVPLPPKP